MDPKGEYLYATRLPGTQHISGFAIESGTGALAEVPGSPLTSENPVSLAVEPSGRFIYVGNDVGGVSVYSLNRSDGSFTELTDSKLQRFMLGQRFAFATLH